MKLLAGAALALVLASQAALAQVPGQGNNIPIGGGSSSSSSIVAGTTVLTCASGTTGVLFQSAGKVGCDSGFTYGGSGGAVTVSGANGGYGLNVQNSAGRGMFVASTNNGGVIDFVIDDLGTSGFTQFQIQNQGVIKFLFQWDGTSIVLDTVANANMQFNTNNTLRGQFTAAGVFQALSGIAAVNTSSGAITVPSGGGIGLTGSIYVGGQIVSSAGLPTIASGACGATSNGAVVAGSTNQTGNITIGAAATTTCTVSFSATLSNAPLSCVIFPTNATAAATGTTVARVSSISTANFVITGAALASANYEYICL